MWKGNTAESLGLVEDADLDITKVKERGCSSAVQLCMDSALRADVKVHFQTMANPPRLLIDHT